MSSIGSKGTFANPDDHELLISVYNDGEAIIITKLLHANGIWPFYDRKTLTLFGQNPSDVFGRYNIYVFREDLIVARELLESVKESVRTSEDLQGEHAIRKKSRGEKIALSVILGLFTLLFSILSYYAFTDSEQFMGYFLAGAAVFTAMVLFFALRGS